jgi:DNA-binding beta-propeller fold protein YncE
MGPPLNVAITPDGALALVSSAFKIDEKKAHVPDNRISVIDLKASPPKVIAVVESGASPSGISITRDGRLALVANRSDGTVSVFRIEGRDLRKLDTISIGAPNSGPSHVAITPDMTMALVTKDGPGVNAVSVLAIEGDKVTYTKRDFFTGTRPYGIVIAPDGKSAVVACVGRGQGDIDTISSVDLTGKWPRVIDTVPVGMSPEGISMSRDGTMVAITIVNATNTAKEFPWHNEKGKVALYRLADFKLTKLSEMPVGAWCQGSGFSADGKTLVVQNILEKRLQVLRIGANGELQDRGESVPLKAGPVGIRVLGNP